MNELLAKIEAALKKIEDRIGHYLEAKSAIPANAVLGNAVEPGLAEELKEAKDALVELCAELDASKNEPDSNKVDTSKIDDHK